MTTGLSVFDTTVSETNAWLAEIQQRLHPCSRQDAYAALRAALHTLRDHLPADAVLGLSAQLPMLVRGLYLEGWTLERPDDYDRSFEGFCRELEARLPTDFGWAGEVTARAVYATLSERIDEGEARKVPSLLPQRLRGLWPLAPVS